MSREHIPAISVAVSSGDGPIWTGAWGFTDLENFVPATADSVFRIGSISKPVTAIATLQLVEDGRLDLQADIRQYLPAFPVKQWPVTMRQLLCHQAGIRNYVGDEFNSTRHYAGVGDALQIFVRDPLVSEPGTKYAYTTYGFNLAGAVVEAVAGVPFANLVRQRILEPAGTVAMQTDDLFRVIPYRARGYRKIAGGAVENCDLADTSNKVPGGGWVATASDIVRIARALLAGKLLKSQAVEIMWTPQKLKNGESTGYGLGWGIYRKDGLLVAEHSGSQQGIRSHLLIVPERRLAIAVLTNLQDSGATEIARLMLDDLLNITP